ncbi:alpha-2-macroglobulin, partial [Myxococcota bacterium]
VKSTPLDRKGNLLSTPVLRLLNVTDIGLSAKYSPSQLVVLAARLSDGKPIAGAKVSAFAVSAGDASDLGEPLATGETDTNGIASFGAAELTRAGEEPNIQKRGLFVTASTDDDEAFIWSSFESGGRRASDKGPGLVGLVYTERGVYRPGETVFYRVVARKQVAGGLATPNGKVEIQAKRGAYHYDESDEDEIFATDQNLSEYGTTHGKFEVPTDAGIGTYSLIAKIGEQRISAQFQVAEFRRAEMKVTVNTNKTEYIRGQKMTVRINADYLFGAPAAGLDMRWSLRRSWGYFNSKRFPNARFSDYDYHSWYDDRDSYSEFVDEEDVTLDDNGSYTFTRKLKKAGGKGRIENLIVSATVEDESGQSVSNRRTVRVHPAAFHAGLIPHGYLKEKDKLFSFEAVAVSPTDEPVAGAKLNVSTYQIYWYSVKRKGPGGRMYWDYKREVIEEDNICSGTTDSSGKISCQYTPRKGGSLRLRIQGQDKRNRKVKASSWFWVTGDPDYYGGRADRGNQVGIMAEAPQVAVGDTARIAITSPFKNALALITVEREDILWRKTMALGSSGVVDIPVAASWAPNVHISASVVRGRVTPEGKTKPDPERDKPAYALGYLNLKVEPTRNVLKVEVSTARNKYEPGHKVRATVSTKNHAGAPVSAEVNLFAVDEGVLMLTNYKTPNLIPALFVTRPYSVLALDTRMHVLGRRHFITPVIKGEDDGGGGGESEDEGEELRQDFNPVATWIGTLVTEDDTGTGVHTFELPDTLTTYRLMAVAVSESDKFGSGDTEIKVAKTLMMRQAMPRFARPGDRMQAGVVVNQLSGKAGDVTVEIEKIDASLFEVRGSNKKSLKVGAKETVAFRFDLEAKDEEGQSEIIFAAKMGKFGDRVQLILPVRRLIPRESQSVAGVLEPGKTSHTLALPQGTRPVQMEINMSGLPVASLEEKVRQLVGYPYGCLEQRTSKVMPLIAIREISKELGFASVPTEKIKGWVEEWVGLVPKYRCSDDGFDYYPGCGSGSDAHLTAFALDGLLTARKFGYKVPDSTIDPAASYLEKQLAKWQGDPARLASPLRVLAQLKRSKRAHETKMFEARAKMPLFAKTDLVRAIYARTGKRNQMVNALLTDITSNAVERGGAIRFKSDSIERYWWAWDSNLRSTALVLRTLLEVEPTDARVPLIVRGLIELDNAETYYTTQGVTQTLLALADAARQLKKMGKKPKATVKVGGKALMSGKTVGTKVEQTTIAAAELGKGPYELSLENRGNGPLYFGAFLHYAYPATARLPAKPEGFRVERHYTDRDGNKIGKSVTVGDYVMVNLKIWVDETGRMVVVDDPLPAGLEPVDTTLATSDTEMAKVMEGASGDWSWWRSRYKEMRDDRTEWHFRRLWSTSNRYPIKLQYLARAVTPGSYYAPGTMVERLYQPHIRGRGVGHEIEVKPKR